MKGMKQAVRQGKKKRKRKIKQRRYKVRDVKETEES
jgi:hypothetical protein